MIEQVGIGEYQLEVKGPEGTLACYMTGTRYDAETIERIGQEIVNGKYDEDELDLPVRCMIFGFFAGIIATVIAAYLWAH